MSNATSSADIDFVKRKKRIKYIRSTYWESKSKGGKEMEWKCLVVRL